MAMDGPKDILKPASVVVGKTGSISSSVNAGNGGMEPFAAQQMGSLENNKEQVARLKLTTAIFSISMFLNWGYQFWLSWFLNRAYNQDGEGWDDGSHNNLWDYIMTSDFAWEGGIGFVELLNFFFHRIRIWGDVADLVGVSFVLFIMRELMPFFFIGMIVFCWKNKETGHDFFRKVAIFNGGYFVIMAGNLVYIWFGLLDSIYRFNLIFDCLGFWLAGFAGLIVHPRAVPIPKMFTPPQYSPSLEVVDSGSENIFNKVTSQTAHAINDWGLVLLYIPLAYFGLMFIGLINGGDDDAAGVGAVIAVIGFLIAIAIYRMEFFKGFGLSFLMSIIYAFIAFILGSILSEDFWESVFWDSDTPDFLITIIIPCTILPIYLHLKGMHTRALGSAYAIPICVFVMLMGLILGIYSM